MTPHDQSMTPHDQSMTAHNQFITTNINKPKYGEMTGRRWDMMKYGMVRLIKLIRDLQALYVQMKWTGDHFLKG